MKSKTLLMLLAAAVCGSVGTKAQAVTVVNGTYSDPSGLIFGTYLSGSESGGITPDPAGYSYISDGGQDSYGNARDYRWLQDISTGGPAANAPSGLLFDLHGLANKLVVFPIIDHGPLPEEAFEYDVFMSNDKVNWTEATLETLYDQGWDADPAIADGWTTVWTMGLNQDFRYASVAWGNPGNPDSSYFYQDGDNEIDAVAGLRADGSPVPEPASFALLGLGLLSLGWKFRLHSGA